VDAWYSHNKKEALADASPAAVAALFRYEYPPGGLDYRGCTSAPWLHATNYCTYRMGAGILEFTVTPAGAGWAVTAAQLES